MAIARIDCFCSIGPLQIISYALEIGLSIIEMVAPGCIADSSAVNLIMPKEALKITSTESYAMSNIRL